jgi:hypothetical protein
MRLVRSFGALVLLAFLFTLGPMLVLAGPPTPAATPTPSSSEIGFGSADGLSTQASKPSRQMFPAAYDGHRARVLLGRDLQKSNVILGAAVTDTQETTIFSEDFEDGTSVFTTTVGAGDNYTWGIVGQDTEPCPSTPGLPVVEPYGSRSIWPAGKVVTTGTIPINPCGLNVKYPANLNVALRYGPFSLLDVSEGDASLDFFYRMTTDDPDGGDIFSWSASKDGVNWSVGGTDEISHESGPFPDGYNFVSFDLAEFLGEPQVWIEFRFVSDSDNKRTGGPFIDAISLRKNTTPKRTIVAADFNTRFSDGYPGGEPYQSWLSFFTEPPPEDPVVPDALRWGSADCFARSGGPPFGSMWMARYGLNNYDYWPALDPCDGGIDEVADQIIDSWLIYGPFNLEGTSAAWVDFYFRGDTEPVPGEVITEGDVIYWWASTDGTNFYGSGLSGGPYTQGREGNGYNRTRFDLSRVPVLDDLRGESTVWLAFVFQSDGDGKGGTLPPDGTGEGVFLDDVELVVIDQAQVTNKEIAVYLPVLMKTESVPAPVGGITFYNNTGNPITLELVGYSTRTFSCPPGESACWNTWLDIPVGTYDWVASGTCPAGAGQVGSTGDTSPMNRPPVTIEEGIITNEINVRDGSQGVFDCSG